MTTPTIHLNGTSGDALIEQYRTAADAVETALKALWKSAPHGRDYYPQGPEALGLATQEFASRVERLQSVSDELQQLMASVYEVTCR